MHIYFTSIIFCLLLGFYAKLFNVIYSTDRSFNFIIENKYKLSSHLSFLLAVLMLVSYIFLIRLNNVGILVEVNDIIDIIWSFIKSLSYPEVTILLLLLLIWLVFWIFLIKLFYQYLKFSLLSLFLYTYQYELFSNCYSEYIKLGLNKTLYLIRRVEIFTDNAIIKKLSILIWPGIWNFLEPIMFTFIIPYLFIFDYLTQDGKISKIFIILPWYFIYMLLRSCNTLFMHFYNFENMQMSRAIYKSLEINGKMYRWVVKPEEFIIEDNNNKN